MQGLQRRFHMRHHTGMQQHRVLARASSRCSIPCRSRPRRLVTATAAPPSDQQQQQQQQQDPVPIKTFRGSLPYLGVLHKVPLDQIPLHVHTEFKETGERCLDLSLFGRSTVCVRHPDDVSHVLKNYAKFNKSPSVRRISRWLGDGLVTELDSEKHARAREVLAPAFRAQSIRDLVPIFSGVAAELTQLLLGSRGQPVELEPITRRATLDVIGRAGLGYDFGALQRAQKALQAGNGSSSSGSSSSSSSLRTRLDTSDEDYIDVVKVYEDILTTAMFLIFDLPFPTWAIPGYSRYNAGVERLEQVVATVLQDRRAHGISPNDKSLLSFMLAAQQADPAGLVTDTHIRDQLMTFMLAGSDTTATTMAFCLFELANRPDVLQEVQQEVRQALGDTPPDQIRSEVFANLNLLTGCINETLRLYPAVPGLARRSLESFQAGPHFIAADTLIVADIYSCHRHPDYWPQAETWLPERWLPGQQLKQLGPQHPDAFQPFSVGPRSCIGRYFAMLEMQVILSLILRDVVFRPVPGRPSSISLTQNFTLKSKDGVFATAEAAC